MLRAVSEVEPRVTSRVVRCPWSVVRCNCQLPTVNCGLRLVHHRLVEAHLAAFSCNHQVAIGVNGNFRVSTFEFRVSIFDTQRDRAGVRARGNHEVVLQFSLIPVIDQINAGIHALVLHLGVSRHIGAPLLGIIADEVIRLAGQFVERCHLGG